jgi:hypothetical protein
MTAVLSCVLVKRQPIILKEGSAVARHGVPESEVNALYPSRHFTSKKTVKLSKDNTIGNPEFSIRNVHP